MIDQRNWSESKTPFDHGGKVHAPQLASPRPHRNLCVVCQFRCISPMPTGDFVTSQMVVSPPAPSYPHIVSPLPQAAWDDLAAFCKR